MKAVGMGWGALAGCDVTHWMIVLTTPKAVRDLVSSSSVQLGAELGVTVGPMGRGANSQLQTGNWTLHRRIRMLTRKDSLLGLVWKDRS